MLCAGKGWDWTPGLLRLRDYQAPAVNEINKVIGRWLSPFSTCPRCYQEGHCAVYCLHVTQDRGTSFPGNSPADLLNLAMDYWRGTRFLDLTTTITSHHDMWVAHLLPLGHWCQILSPNRVLGPTCPSCLPIVGIGIQPYLLHQTPPPNCIFRIVCLTHSFWYCQHVLFPYWEGIFQLSWETLFALLPTFTQTQAC